MVEKDGRVAGDDDSGGGCGCGPRIHQTPQWERNRPAFAELTCATRSSCGRLHFLLATSRHRLLLRKTVAAAAAASASATSAVLSLLVSSLSLRALSIGDKCGNIEEGDG